MTYLRSRLKRLEKVMAPANEEPIRITVEYVDVSGGTVGGYDVVVPPRPRIARLTRSDCGFPICQMITDIHR